MLRKQREAPLGRGRKQERSGSVKGDPTGILLGAPILATARNVLGNSVDRILAKRLPKQPDSVVGLVLDKVRRTRFLRCNSGKFSVRKEPIDRAVPWTRTLLPVQIRRLEWPRNAGTQRSPCVETTLRDINVARAWLSGVVAFHADDFWAPDLRKYVGRLSNSAFCFVRTPTRDIVRRFISLAIQNKIRYINYLGSIHRKELLMDPLLAIYYRSILSDQITRKMTKRGDQIL